MAVIYEYPLSESFAGVRGLSADGSNPAGDAAPTGIGTSLSIVDGWAKFVLAEDDAYTNGGLRTEISGENEAVPSERLYRWECRLGNDWPLDAAGVEFAIMQMHSNPDAAVVAENVLIICNGHRGWLYLPNLQPPAEGTLSGTAASWPMVAGGSYSFALHVGWSKVGAGFMRMYVNGRVVFGDSLRGTAYDDAVGPYFKAGVYKQDAETVFGTRTSYIRNVVVTDGLNGESWSSLLGDIPRPVPWAVGP